MSECPYTLEYEPSEQHLEKSQLANPISTRPHGYSSYDYYRYRYYHKHD